MQLKRTCKPAVALLPTKEDSLEHRKHGFCDGAKLLCLHPKQKQQKYSQDHRGDCHHKRKVAEVWQRSCVWVPDARFGGTMSVRSHGTTFQHLATFHAVIQGLKGTEWRAASQPWHDHCLIFGKYLTRLTPKQCQNRPLHHIPCSPTSSLQCKKCVHPCQNILP